MCRNENLRRRYYSLVKPHVISMSSSTKSRIQMTVGFCTVVVLLAILIHFNYPRTLPIELAVELESPSTEVEPVDYQIPNDDILARSNTTELMKIFWTYINRLQVLCKDVVRVGSLIDGGKEICIDPGYKPKPPCIVYSFGINNEWDFDKAIVEWFGCDVYCFDPSMRRDTQQISEHIWFYKWGLGPEDHINSKNWTIKTLKTIRGDLGHTNKVIDIFKMDIEGGEWASIPQMISSDALHNVKQIAMETHFSTKSSVKQRKQLSTLRQLYDSGYRIFMRDRNLVVSNKFPGIIGKVTNFNEISLILPNNE